VNILSINQIVLLGDAFAPVVAYIAATVLTLTAASFVI
jgi:hypothetical protein